MIPEFIQQMAYFCLRITLAMIEIGNKIITEDLLKKEFVCNLTKCKGICCVEGDSGAPLEEEELTILDDIFEDIQSVLRPEGIQAIKKQGKYITDFDGDYVTPLVNGKECAYVIFNNDGSTRCGIEKANAMGLTNYKKPISCHLYPIRTIEYEEFTAVHYHVWKVCSDACTMGNELGVKVYEFLEEPLTRKFGKHWYAELKKVAIEYQKKV